METPINLRTDTWLEQYRLELRMKEGGNFEIPVIEIFKTNSEAILLQLNTVPGSAVKIPGRGWGSGKR